ncbi:MAG: GNAT family N-acetyltransferase [Candidatus Latescibacterota bacterium]|nr:GNAT family N-acetyltransferase [Candidatus Latescibacterota bacterium]
MEKFDAYTAEPERLAGSRAVECDGRLVAATFASQRSRDPLAGALDFVVCHPEHRGRRLGLIVCAAAIEHLADQGYATISLQTDDWRLAAIKTYFNLGFEPVMTRIDMPDRWLKVIQQLHLT